MTMRNDATRQRIPVAEKRRLRRVVARQGQVMLDTDVNDGAQLLLDRVETADAYMLGPPDRLLYPAGTGGFLMSGGTTSSVNFEPGLAYLNGWQVENVARCSLTTQANPFPGSSPGPPFAMVLKALVRHIDPAEEGGLADVALGDAQTSGRALIDWQIFPLENLPNSE
jgi:hypothetical protein